jgi:hypothetical protein
MRFDAAHGWSLFFVTVVLPVACGDRAPTPPRIDVPSAALPTIPPGPYTPGQSYYGRNNYIQYVAGNLPVIFSAPHGGRLTPAEIPNRSDAACGATVVTTADLNTDSLAYAIRDAFFARTGKYPHIIINHLHRKKLDANRPQSDGACGDAEANTAWQEFQDFIGVAKTRASTDYGKGWYTDLHGHAHAIDRLELGWLLSGDQLRLSDATLNASTTYENISSMKVFSQQSGMSFSALLRGRTSLGTMLALEGYPATPSTSDSYPNVGESYFNGGYNTETHGCDGGGTMCGVQIEHHKPGVRDSAASWNAYAATLARTYETYLAQNFGISLASTKGEIVVDNDNAVNDTLKAKFSASANWTTATGEAEKYFDNYRLTDGAGPTNDGASFYFRISTTGTYKVYARWTDNANRSTSVSYRVFALDGGTMLADLTRNQQSGGGTWNLLGTWDFPSTGWAKVLISRSLSGSGKLSADAIRAVRQ